MNYFDIRDDSHYLFPILFSFLSRFQVCFRPLMFILCLRIYSKILHCSITTLVYTFIAVWACNFKSVSCPILRVNELNISLRWTGKFKDTTDKLAPKLDYRIN